MLGSQSIDLSFYTGWVGSCRTLNGRKTAIAVLGLWIFLLLLKMFADILHHDSNSLDCSLKFLSDDSKLLGPVANLMHFIDIDADASCWPRWLRSADIAPPLCEKVMLTGQRIGFSSLLHCPVGVALGCP